MAFLKWLILLKTFIRQDELFYFSQTYVNDDADDRFMARSRLSNSLYCILSSSTLGEELCFYVRDKTEFFIWILKVNTIAKMRLYVPIFHGNVIRLSLGRSFHCNETERTDGDAHFTIKTESRKKVFSAYRTFYS